MTDGGSSGQENLPELPRPMLNADGKPFDDELEDFIEVLAALENTERDRYRAINATAIAQADASHLLIVAGPGSGKSFLFLERIRFWTNKNPGVRIYVASFVRKLVRDLQFEIEQKIEEHRDRIDISTLHGLARSLIERNDGDPTHPREGDVSVIPEHWKDTVWTDVLAFFPADVGGSYSRFELEEAFYKEEFPTTGSWADLIDHFEKLCEFYNAVGFADMIYIARLAVESNPELSPHDLWIVDEYQDLNPSEDHLVRSLIRNGKGSLLAGDDEQALYQVLKQSIPDIIVSYYESDRYANAMLPYCSRCSYYVCLAASDFISRGREDDAIKKIYLPFEVDKGAAKVQVIAPTTPAAAADYIDRFLKGYANEFEEYLMRVAQGKEHDPFLLILTPSRSLSYLGESEVALQELVEKYSEMGAQRSRDYWTLMDLLKAGEHPDDNFAFRKVLHHLGYSPAQVHLLIEEALTSACNLSDLDVDLVMSALEACRKVAAIMSNEELSVSEKVSGLGQLLKLAKPDRLVEELEASDSQPDNEGEEAVETAGTARPVELLTMVGSKGLSAHHVIVLGCDNVNMGKTSRLTFFVAMTRARKSLHLLAAAKAGGAKSLHRYLRELAGTYCEYKVHKMSGDESYKSVNDLDRRFKAWEYGAQQSRGGAKKTSPRGRRPRQGRRP
ncbi:MAG: AAA family ATPase [Actinomycetota bacterium]|nr:AAA family ATPase [Actinomycetota bacterium]